MHFESVTQTEPASMRGGTDWPRVGNWEKADGRSARRVEAALRGARLAGHMPMKAKKAAKKTKPKKKQNTKA